MAQMPAIRAVRWWRDAHALINRYVLIGDSELLVAKEAKHGEYSSK